MESIFKFNTRIEEKKKTVRIVRQLRIECFRIRKKKTEQRKNQMDGSSPNENVIITVIRTVSSAYAELYPDSR